MESVLQKNTLQPDRHGNSLNRMSPNISEKPGLYIHIPYCDTKCGYCDFYSITSEAGRADFISAVTREMRETADKQAAGPFDTIYFGGGTPSLLTEFELEALLRAAAEYFEFAPDMEITLEANPGTLSLQKLHSFKSLGINRLSMGVQSFNDDLLRFLGRIHDSHQAIRSVEEARQAGFDNLSIDLIFSIPGQPPQVWRQSLEQAIALQTEHISAYSLIFEEGTPFFHQMTTGQITPNEDELESYFFTETRRFFSNGGWLSYEVSNFARAPEFISRHNFKYWQLNGYLGFGPSAHSFWNNTRWGNVRSVTGYNQKILSGKSARQFSETIDPPTAVFELVFLSLRTWRGLNLVEFRQRFGYDFRLRHREFINRLLKRSLAVLTPEHFYLTEEGLAISDSIITDFTV